MVVKAKSTDLDAWRKYIYIYTYIYNYTWLQKKGIFKESLLGKIFSRRRAIWGGEGGSKQDFGLSQKKNSPMEARLLDKMIEVEECKKSLFSLEDKKSLGWDGLTTKIFKDFLARVTKMSISYC